MTIPVTHTTQQSPFHGNERIMAGPVGEVDGCSNKPVALIGNGAISQFSPVSQMEVDRAYQEFDVPCRSHDYAYDLIRHAWRTPVVVTDWGWKARPRKADLIRDREDADGELREMSSGVCNDTGWVVWFDVWDKTTCWKLRDLMYNGVRAWTWAEGIPG